MSDPKAESKEPKESKKQPAKEKEAHPKPVVHHVSNKPHHLKLSRMNLQQINHALEEAQQKMGGTTSQYVRFLVARRDYLSGSSWQTQRKAA